VTRSPRRWNSLHTARTGRISPRSTPLTLRRPAAALWPPYCRPSPRASARCTPAAHPGASNSPRSGARLELPRRICTATECQSRQSASNASSCRCQATQASEDNPLLTPYKLGPFDLKHRIVYAPLTRCRCMAGEGGAWRSCRPPAARAGAPAASPMPHAPFQIRSRAVTCLLLPSPSPACTAGVAKPAAAHHTTHASGTPPSPAPSLFQGL
jgi:hypothetical protein